MRPSTARSTYICLPCLLQSSNASKSGWRLYEPAGRVFQQACRAWNSLAKSTPAVHARDGKTHSCIDPHQKRSGSTSSSEAVRLDPSQMSKVGNLYLLHALLKKKLPALPDSTEARNALPVEQVLAALRSAGDPVPLDKVVEKAYGSHTLEELGRDLSKIISHRRPSADTVTDDTSIKVLTKLGVIEEAKAPDAAQGKSGKAKSDSKNKDKAALGDAGHGPVAKESRKGRGVRLKAQRPGRRASSVPLKKAASTSSPKKAAAKSKTVRGKSAHVPPTSARRGEKDAGAQAALPIPAHAMCIDGAFISMRAIETEDETKVPRLSFDLSRVLFNPGIYHLQDPRSRVYNFDPYLEKIMPVSEFNFGALNPYITSSQDELLRSISLKHEKKYIGSSSSMTGAMSQFHFLLSAWRPIDASILSQKMFGLNTFTLITRAPASIYLRWRDGVYAIDADKEFDSPNILMMQGKSMEKLLTCEKEEFEKYRKPKAGEQAPAIDSDPEAYHYSTVENFLLRSQLDAYDPRLPGTGMFDLKTRAVAGVRMLLREPELGMNYQIKDRFGEWESFDREYFDMIRAAFLKYSLQVRMGRMDGIFVAYHNISRIFGFQYISLNELDLALHGQADPCLGHREFKVTLKLMNEIFDQATRDFPGQSIRLLFDTKDPTKTHPNGIMRIFAEPMEEAEIDRLQKAAKDRVEDYEVKISAGIDPRADEKKGVSIAEKLAPSTLESSAPDHAFLEQILSQPNGHKPDTVPATSSAGPKKIISWNLSIFNEVNGRSVVRPTKLSPQDFWKVHYVLARNDATAQSAYNNTRSKRAEALNVEDASRARDNWFLNRIRGMSESGKTWREEQDALDAQREKVVLYGSGTSPDSSAVRAGEGSSQFVH